MKVIITGGTGFIGRALSASLATDGHDVVVLSRFAGGTYQGVRHMRAPVVRDEASGRYRFGAEASREIDGADVVINLAGAGIADGRWTAARKAVLKESRLSVTSAIVSAIESATNKPSVLLSGSAIGVYGSDLTATFDESSPTGRDFLAELCVEWEQAALKAEAIGTRVVLLRTGLVLARDGGLLSKLRPPFMFFMGGPTGSGQQWMSWIHRDDWIAMVKWAMTTESVRGPLNVTAPAPATNTDFSRALGAALHRPSFMPLPAFALRLMFGELADGALLASQKVVPGKAIAGGFQFKYAGLDGALKGSV